MSQKPSFKQLRALELLRKDPELSAPQIAQRVGSKTTQVNRWLQQAGMTPGKHYDGIAFLFSGRKTK